MGKIEITVCQARNLHNPQHFGLPDVFARIIAGEKSYKTNVVKNSFAPEWEETFRFMIADEMSTQLRFELYNKCTYNDDLMGVYTLSLGGLTRGIVKDQWYILDKSKTQAELRVRVLTVDFGAEPDPKDSWMTTVDITRDPVQRAIEDGTWRPGQKNPPPPSGPPQPQVVQVVQAPPAQVVVAQPQPQVVLQPQPQVVVQQQPPPQAVHYSPQPPVVAMTGIPQPQPMYAQPQPMYAQPPPQPMYAQPPPQPMYAQPQPMYAQPQQVYGQPQLYMQPQQQPYYPPPQQAYAPGPYSQNMGAPAPNQAGYRY